MKLVPIAPADYPAIAAHVAKWLGSIIEGGGGRRYTEADIRDGIGSGKYWLAIAVTEDAPLAALLAAPIHWPGGLIELEIIGLAGEHRIDWQDLEWELRKVAKGLGFQRIRALARPGWARVMKNKGWHETHRVLDMEL